MKLFYQIQKKQKQKIILENNIINQKIKLNSKNKEMKKIQNKLLNFYSILNIFYLDKK